MKKYLKTKKNNFEINDDKLICIDPACKKQLSMLEIKNALGNDEFLRFSDIRIRHLAGIKYCPNPKHCDAQLIVDTNHPDK